MCSQILQMVQTTRVKEASSSPPPLTPQITPDFQIAFSLPAFHPLPTPSNPLYRLFHPPHLCLNPLKCLGLL